MTSPFNLPSSTMLLGKVSNVFKSGKIFQLRNQHIIFVCGGSVQPRKRSMRAHFMRYAQDSLENFSIFLAESATQDITKHGDPEFINIADFETLIVEVSDCILLFPESAGSIAEIGFFTNSKNAISKLMVVNDIKKQSDSFINIGLIDRINSKSTFRPIISMNYNKPDLLQIKQRLCDRLPARTAKKLEFVEFSNFGLKQKLFIILQIIFIFKALKFESIIDCLEKIFSKVKRTKQVRHLLSILVAVNYLERKGDDLEYFVLTSNAKPFLEFRNFDINELQADAVSFFEKNHSETYNIIQEISR
jgi:hypothetical protein